MSNPLLLALPWWRPVLAIVCLIIAAGLIAYVVFSELRRWSNGDF